MIGTSGSDPRKGQERNQEKSECKEEEARETQSDTQDTMNTNLAEGCNPCKPKSTLIPKVIQEDLQTQLYKNQMKVHALI
jgi:hypothetical protein